MFSESFIPPATDVPFPEREEPEPPDGGEETEAECGCKSSIGRDD